MVKAFFFFSPVDDVEAPVTYCPVIYFLNRSMLFKENTQSYPRKYTKKAQIAYTFFFFFLCTNKRSLSEACKECDKFRRSDMEKESYIT